jgi:hypothetical protein
MREWVDKSPFHHLVPELLELLQLRAMPHPFGCVLYERMGRHLGYLRLRFVFHCILYCIKSLLTRLGRACQGRFVAIFNLFAAQQKHGRAQDVPRKY